MKTSNLLPSVVLLATVTALSLGCGGSSSPTPTATPPPAPSYILLRVDTVRVAPHRPNGSSWDDVEPPHDDPFCLIVGATAGGVALAYAPPAAPTALGTATALCKALDPPAQRQHDPTLPDLQVRLSAGMGAPYVTDTIADTTLSNFAEAFVVPMDAIPPDGLRLEVVDNDDPQSSSAGRAETIATLRISRDELVGALASPTHMIRRPQAPALLELELVVTPYGSTTAHATMSANEGTKDTRLTAFSGEVLRVRAVGSYHVGTWHSEELSPAGYPGGGPMRYNWPVEPLASAPHGSAFLLVGRHTRTAHLTPGCTTVLVSHPGPIVLGVNDKEPENNTGSLSFTIERRPPSAAEWLQQTPRNDCW